MDMKRGFVTVATGSYYCWLAEGLVMSYKLFSQAKYPMYAITDKKGAKRLKKVFDGVVVLDEPHYTFLDKMTILQNTPFDETVFIDADAHIVTDISYLFDDFAAVGSAVSCVGGMRRITADDPPIHFGKEAVEHFGIKNYVSFNGGVYYFRKCAEAAACIDLIFGDLIPHYRDYRLKEFRNGQMADEPLYGLAMAVCDMQALESDKDIMKLLQDYHTLSWDMEKKKCRFIWYGREVSPAILHYGTHNTYTRKYVRYTTRVRCRCRHVPGVFVPFATAWNMIVLLLRHMGRQNDREALGNWFKAHFTKDYIIRFKNKIKALFKRT